MYVRYLIRKRKFIQQIRYVCWNIPSSTFNGTYLGKPYWWWDIPLALLLGEWGANTPTSWLKGKHQMPSFVLNQHKQSHVNEATKFLAWLHYRRVLACHWSECISTTHQGNTIKKGNDFMEAHRFVVFCGINIPWQYVTMGWSNKCNWTWSEGSLLDWNGQLQGRTIKTSVFMVKECLYSTNG
jgi:hypothetical protein